MRKYMLHPAFRDSRLKQISFTPQLQPYYDIVRDYLVFLHDTAKTNIVIKGFSLSEDGTKIDDAIEISRPYRHRWTEPYRKGRIAKGYALEDWLKDNPSPVTLMTMTGYHDYNRFGKKVSDGHTLLTTFDSVKFGYDRLRQMIRKDYPSLQWFNTWEPHETGYPHMHSAVFGVFKEKDIERYQDHWSKKLRIGDKEHGLHFEVSRNDSVTSIRNYLIGYCNKHLLPSRDEWTPEELTFNALTWRYRYRTFTATREIGRAMKMPDYHHNFLWVSTHLLADLPGLHIEKDLNKNKNPDVHRVYGILAG